MTTSGLAAPPRAARHRARRPEPQPPPPPTKPSRRERPSFERILGWSLLGSLVLHLLFLLLSPLVVRVGAPAGDVAAVTGEARPFGMEMVIAIPSENAPDEPLPVLQDDRSAPAPALQAPRTPPLDAGTPARPGAAPAQGAPAQDAPARQSSGEALRPGLRDSRLYVTPRQFPDLEKTEHERYMEHLQARIDAVNDSMNVAANRERRTADWTVTDGDGNRWGLSSQGLHVGGLTIPRELLPLPAPTGDNQSLEADRERQRQRDEIQRQQGDSDRRQTGTERTEAIRERENQRRGGGGGS
jgi:hypothetical protein